MAGLNAELTCEAVQDALERHVAQSSPLGADVQAHLLGCTECREHLAFLQSLQLAVLEDVPPVAPPATLREQMLEKARVSELKTSESPREAVQRPWWPWALGAAAAVTGVLVWTSLLPSRGFAATLPDPAVVVNTAGGLLVASNGQTATLSVIQGNKVTASLSAGGRQKAWFTQGVRLGDQVYLADAANDRVLQVNVSPLNIVKVYPVPNGVAGLTASSGPDGGRVYFKSVRGAVGTLGGTQVTIAQEKGMPLADVMDGVLLAGGKLFVTHHVSGEICILDPQTLSVEKRLKVGGMPVELAAYRGGLLALDVTGRLLHLNLQGDVLGEWKLLGHPDKLGLNGDMVLVTDRSGQVTSIELPSGKLSPLAVTNPMDITPLSDGTFAVAEGGRGVRVVDMHLNTAMQLEHGK